MYYYYYLSITLIYGNLAPFIVPRYYRDLSIFSFNFQQVNW